MSCHRAWREGLISLQTGNSAPPEAWCCHLRAGVCCQGLGWQIECCPEYTELLLCCFFPVDSYLISCFRQELELDSVGEWTCKWYLQGFGVEYCQSKWVRRREGVLRMCLCRTHLHVGLVIYYALGAYSPCLPPCACVCRRAIYIRGMYMSSLKYEVPNWGAWEVRERSIAPASCPEMICCLLLGFHFMVKCEVNGWSYMTEASVSLTGASISSCGSKRIQHSLSSRATTACLCKGLFQYTQSRIIKNNDWPAFNSPISFVFYRIPQMICASI